MGSAQELSSAAGGFEKPVVYVSKCLGFDYCRYNGLIISSEAVKNMHGYVKFALVCPEVEIGLGVPRHPIRLVKSDGELRLKQSVTETDLTDSMSAFTDNLFGSMTTVEGFILKSGSPSCGIHGVKIYPALGKVKSFAKGAGLFGGAVLKRFSHVAVEDEGRLSNFLVREQFLTRIFSLAEFRKIRDKLRMRDLIEFQSQHKYILMSYSQKELRILGRIVANHEKLPAAEVFSLYHEHLLKALAVSPRRTSHINTLQHVMGHFSKVIAPAERSFLLGLLEQYRNKRVPLSVPLNLMRSYAIRFEDGYLKNQAYFEPYPSKLMEITDSGKGRDLKK